MDERIEERFKQIRELVSGDIDASLLRQILREAVGLALNQQDYGLMVNLALLVLFESTEDKDVLDEFNAALAEQSDEKINEWIGELLHSLPPYESGQLPEGYTPEWVQMLIILALFAITRIHIDVVPRILIIWKICQLQEDYKQLFSAHFKQLTAEEIVHWVRHLNSALSFETVENDEAEGILSLIGKLVDIRALSGVVDFYERICLGKLENIDPERLLPRAKEVIDKLLVRTKFADEFARVADERTLRLALKLYEKEDQTVVGALLLDSCIDLVMYSGDESQEVRDNVQKRLANARLLFLTAALSGLSEGAEGEIHPILPEDLAIEMLDLLLEAEIDPGFVVAMKIIDKLYDAIALWETTDAHLVDMRLRMLVGKIQLLLPD